jgi:hypothetical protein
VVEGASGGVTAKVGDDRQRALSLGLYCRGR